MRESLKDGDSTVVIQVNFTENYTKKIRMQFNHPTGYQSNLLYLLCVPGKKNGCHSIVIASDYLSHNKYAVLVFISMLVDHLKHIR